MRIAVTGSGGRVGGQVVELLAARGDHETRALHRRTPSVIGGESAYADYADYADPASLVAALHGVDTLVFVSSDGPAEQVLLHHQNVVSAATECGVGHVVALSGLDADIASPFCYAVTNGVTERLLRAGPMSFSIARASIFTEFFLPWLVRAAQTGELRLPAGDAQVSLVSRDDVSGCLAALAVAPPTERTHDLTGPEAFDLPALAALVADVWQTPVRHLDVSPDEFHRDLARDGEDPWWTYAYSTMFTSIRDHRWARTSTEVERLTGRPAASLRSLLEARRDVSGRRPR